MFENPAEQITMLLHAAKLGQPGAIDRLFSAVYNQLRKIARNRIGAGDHWTTGPTAVVHEMYLRLFKKEVPSWEDRHHFFWAATRAMRDILVERARSAKAIKRGGDRKRVELREDMASPAEPPDLLELNEALNHLELVHPIPFKVVTYRFFTGLSREEIAEIMGVSVSTVSREWYFARAWLLEKMSEGGHAGNLVKS